MNFKEYSDLARTTVCYPKDKGLEYSVLGLCGECGEIANKVKKIIRGDKVLTQEVKEDLASEAGDVLWYLFALSDEIGIPLEVIAHKNIDKLNSRLKRGCVKGDGDNR